MVFGNDKVKRYFSFFTLIIFCNLNFSCAYYRVKSGPVGDTKTARTLKRNSFRTNYYVLHVGDAMWEVRNFNMGSSIVKGELATFGGDPLAMYNRMISGQSRRVTFRESEYAYQVHLYADAFTDDGGSFRLKESDINRIDLFDINQGVRIVSALGTTMLVGTAGLGLLLFLACSCPHVYVYSGETYHLTNSLFTGSVAPQLERDDFKIMPDYFANSDEYQFYVKNEEQEEQYTNLLKLMVVEHEAGTEVYPDQQGNVHMVKAPIMPTQITDDGHKDLSELVNYHDGRAFVFNNETAEDFSNVYATFDVPTDRANAKLILQAKNTDWSGHVYGEFTKLFGSYYDNWVAKNQRKKTREEMLEDQKKHGLPLLISVKSGEEWIDIETIDLMGTISYNGLAVNIPQELLTEEQLQVRVRSGFMFWKLDYLALDCSANVGYELQTLDPTIATGEDGKDFRSELNGDDDLYMHHPLNADSTYIKFTGLPLSSDKSRTIILHSKGYYLPLTEFDTKMERKELAKFKAYGELSRYSKRLFKDAFGDMDLVLE